MGNKVLSTCPVCSSRLKVKKLACGRCGTEINGDFELTKFNYLDKNQLYFIEVFIKNRGNIKEIEKELGISYPTVRRSLDAVIEALGYSPTKQEIIEPKTSKQDILDKLDKGEITSEEALNMLKGVEK